MPRLIVMDYPGKTRQVALDQPENRIGRAPHNEIQVDAEEVSRSHAVFIVEPAFVTLKDLGSRNGTYVNGVRIGMQVLASGDSIRIGPCEMRFLASEQEFTQVEALRLMTIPGLLVDIDRQAQRPATPPPR